MTAQNEEGAGREVFYRRVLAAPRERVFEAFSDPRQLARWWGPVGFINTMQEFEFKAGGRWHLLMRGPDGTEYPNEWRFVEIVRPERIVLEHLAPMHWFRMTVTFDQQGAQTALAWTMRFESAEECARVRTFVDEANAQNFDRLEALLAQDNPHRPE